MSRRKRKYTKRAKAVEGTSNGSEFYNAVPVDAAPHETPKQKIARLERELDNFKELYEQSRGSSTRLYNQVQELEAKLTNYNLIAKLIKYLPNPL